jgi:hypothetical protein
MESNNIEAREKYLKNESKGYINKGWRYKVLKGY